MLSSDKTKNQLKLDHLRTFFLQLVQGVQDWVVDDPPRVDGDQEVEMVATWNYKFSWGQLSKMVGIIA